MARFRYWKLTTDEVRELKHDTEKVLNWEIKGIREPEDEAKFIGIFTYRNGAPHDYEPIKGIVYYHNNINRKELPEITKFLKKKFGGDEMEKGERIFLKNSDVPYSGADIAELAKEFEEKFNTKSIISIELNNTTQDQLKEWNYPDSKLIPIP